MLLLNAMKIPPIDSSSADGEVLDHSSFKGNILFKNIEFSYPSRPDIKVSYMYLDNSSGKIIVDLATATLGKNGPPIFFFFFLTEFKGL